MGDTQDYKFHPRLSNPYGLRGNPDTQAKMNLLVNEALKNLYRTGNISIAYDSVIEKVNDLMKGIEDKGGGDDDDDSARKKQEDLT